ncbi:MAG: helix-turn-helix transcriptional regulator [Deltaproteobacteria bacterium]|nr:helix-turn-helix transcriptional regulator [Deltaproteobacteria bacterium]
MEATKLFARRGYHKTTVADIASAIGMTQGALFHHFPSKDALLQAVVERLARGMDSYRAPLAEGGSADAVRKIVNLMVEHFNRQPEATICLAALATEFAGTDDPILERIRRIYDRFVDPFAIVLSTHPTVRDPRAAAISFIGAVQGIAIQGLLREGNPPLAALAPAFLDMMNMPVKW